jgi:3-hydroxyethyl bacteriochlorophyllide a dehydrogenase
MKTTAVVLEQPEQLKLSTLPLTAPGDGDVVVDIDFSGISTGTERLLWNGRMPMFPAWATRWCPAMNRWAACVEAGPLAQPCVGERVFVPGARCYREVRGLFGGAASAWWCPAPRDHAHRRDRAGPAGRAAGAGRHGVPRGGLRRKHPLHPARPDRRPRRAGPPAGAPGGGWPVPHRWCGKQPRRAAWRRGLHRHDPATDTRRNYRAIYDVSGDAAILDTLIAAWRRRRGGARRLLQRAAEPSCSRPPSCAKPASASAAEWQRADLAGAQPGRKRARCHSTA